MAKLEEDAVSNHKDQTAQSPVVVVEETGQESTLPKVSKMEHSPKD